MQERLERELERLRLKLALDDELTVVWVPDSSKSLSAEVKDKTVYIYESRKEEAIKVLKHEVLDHYITSRIINPLVTLVNLLIKSREVEIYKEKEKLVENLSKLLD